MCLHETIISLPLSFVSKCSEQVFYYHGTKEWHARLQFANITVKDELYIYSLKTKGVGILNSDVTQTDRVNRQNDGAP